MRRNKRREKDIARQRIVRLLRLADSIYIEEPELAIKYGKLARRIAQRSRVRIPREWKWRYCKRCKTLLYPGINARIRLKDRRFPHLIIKCELCGGIRRIPYLNEKKRIKE